MMKSGSAALNFHYWKALKSFRVKTGIAIFVTIWAISAFPSVSSSLAPFSKPNKISQIVDVYKIEADRLLQQGIQQLNNGQLEAATLLWQQALLMYRDIKDRLGESKSLRLLAHTYFLLNDATKTIDFSQQWLDLTRNLKDRENEKQALLMIGNAFILIDDYAKAINRFQELLALARTIKNPKDEEEALENLGTAHLLSGDHLKAIDYFKQRLALARELKDYQDEGKALKSLAEAYNSLGDYANAIDYYQQSLAITRQFQNSENEVLILGELGKAYDYLGEYGKAIDYYQLGLKTARKLQSHSNEVLFLGKIGQSYKKRGDYTKGIDYQQQSLAVASELKDRGNEIFVLLELAQSSINLGSLGNFAQELEYSQKVLAIAQKLKDPRFEILVMLRLGGTYARYSYTNIALDYYQQGLRIARNIKDRNSEKNFLELLALVESTENGYATAIEYYQQELSIVRELKQGGDEQRILGHLGTIYLTLGDYAKTIDYSQQELVLAQKLKDPLTEGEALQLLGNAYAGLKNYAKAIDYQQQSLTIARKIKNVQFEQQVLADLGAIFYKSGNLAVAEKTLLESIKVNESIRARLGKNDEEKVFTLDLHRDSYATLQQVLIAQNKINAALEISERGRARAVLELLVRRLSSNQVKPLNITPSKIEQIQHIARQKNTTLVEYSIISELVPGSDEQNQDLELYIWVVKPTGEVGFRHVELKPFLREQKLSLEQLVTGSRESLGVRGRGDSIIIEPISETEATNLKNLYKILIAPIADLLPSDSNAHVIFMPQDELFLVPFSALQDENGEYLIEKYTILTAPAIQVLDLTQQQRAKVQQANPKGIVIVGNPTMPKVTIKIGQPPEQLKPLPAAKDEAIAIAKLFNTKSFIGNQATKAAILPKLSQARIVHLATHGLLDDFIGLGVPGAIALAPSGNGQPNDGLLTADEILGLKLNAELVVLSACDTGRGTITSDGVIGLSRSLITAGTPSLIVSLWSVPDAPTAELMTKFYRNWLSRKLDKAQALRQAMLATMKNHPHPKDWAAFTLIGEAE